MWNMTLYSLMTLKVNIICQIQSTEFEYKTKQQLLNQFAYVFKENTGFGLHHFWDFEDWHNTLILVKKEEYIGGKVLSYKQLPILVFNFGFIATKSKRKFDLSRPLW